MISPQGYSLGEDPKAKNPFWDGEGEDSDVNRIYATATVDDQIGTPSVQTTKSIDGHDITFGFEFHNLKGRDGTDGRDGTNGTNGVSPTITVTDITGGHRVSITDATGTHSFDVMNGQNGRDGRDGTNGADGRDGRDGTNGTDGRDGTDGVSPSVSVSDITGGHRITVTDATGSETFDVMNGTDGTDGVSPTITVTDITGGHKVSITDAQGTDTFNVMDGQDGRDGTNGVSPTVSVTSITGGHQVSITDAQGTDTFNVMDGQDGVTPDITMSATSDATSSANPTVTVTKGGTTANPTFALAFSGLKGTAGSNGQGVPAGGTAGQVLTKVNGTDYNTKWATPSSGGANLKTARFESSFDSGTAVATGFYRCPITVRNAASLVSIFENSWTNKKFFDAQITVNPNYGPFAYKPAFISKSGSSITLNVYSSSDLNNKTAHVVFIYEE